jgi:ankyrin repeat protein
LLFALFEGNVDTVEYFLSDAPLRRFLDFASTFQYDKRLKALSQTEEGIKGAVQSWLLTGNHLALHIALMSAPDEDGSQPVFEFVLERRPDLLEIRDADGFTPLQLALSEKRYLAAKKLIDAGADQTTKDIKGRNIMHTILGNMSTDQPSALKAVISMIDDKLIGPLLLERCSSIDFVSTTPLAIFVDTMGDNAAWKDHLKYVLSLDNGKGLIFTDSSGDYILHTATRRGLEGLVRFLVEYQPGLLYWENATGMLPIDVASTRYLQSLVEHPPKLNETRERSIRDQAPSAFDNSRISETRLERFDADGVEARSDEWKMYHLIKDLMDKHPAKRKLVSLSNANEVAKRLALHQKRQNEENQRRARRQALRAQGNDDPDDDTEENVKDEVSHFKSRAQDQVRWDEMVWMRDQAGINEMDGKPIEEHYQKLARQSRPMGGYARSTGGRAPRMLLASGAAARYR